jgi:hypothetical protein
VPGDRQDVIHATLAANRTQQALDREPRLLERLRGRSRFGRVPQDRGTTSLAGMILSGGYRPSARELDAIRQSGLFAYLVAQETYTVASEVHDLLVKTHPADTAKIDEIRRLVADHFDIEGLIDRIDRHAAAEASPLARSATFVRSGLQRVVRASRTAVGGGDPG